MLWPLIRYHHRTVAWDLPSPAPTGPDSQHILGTDDQARDVAARLIYGFRISVLFRVHAGCRIQCDRRAGRAGARLLWRLA